MKGSTALRVIGIISEYNPFHNGHAYQIDTLRRIYPDAVIAAIMSPNFVQRGEAALFDKYSRAHSAVLGGVDAVFSLPLVFANLSAEGFAEAGVRLAHSLKIDTLSFGVECDECKSLFEIADLMLSDGFSERVDKICASTPSLSLTRAIQKSIEEALGENASKTVSQPNNILALEYIKAIKRLKLPIDVLPIKREGEGYKSLKASPLPSALLLRQKILQKEQICGLIPEACGILYNELIASGSFCDTEFFSKLLQSSLLLKTAEETERCFGSFELASKFRKQLLSSSSLDEAIDKTVGTRFTRTRIKRSVISAFFGIAHNEFIHEEPKFTQLLALSEKGRAHLSALRHSSFPIIVKNADAEKHEDYTSFKRQLDFEKAADRIWAQSQHRPCSPDIFMKKSPFVKGQ